MPHKSESLLTPSGETAAWSRAVAELCAEALRAGHQVRLRVTGTSMIPALWPADEVVVEPICSRQPLSGQIALAISDGRLISHRIIAVPGCDSCLLTRGDAVPTCDPPLKFSDLLGIVTGLVRDDVVHDIDPLSLPRQLLALGARHSNLIRTAAMLMHRAGVV